MTMRCLVSRQTLASTSRHTLPPSPLATPHLLRRQTTRTYAVLGSRNSDPFPFFTPPFLPPTAPWGPEYRLPDRKGKGKALQEEDGGNDGEPRKGGNGEQEVDDREWEIRVARGMLHLRDTLPRLFHPSQTSAVMFPPDVFSQHVVLKLPAPFPLKISGLTPYSMAFALARNGMHAFHTDLHCSLERMTFSATPSEAVKQDPAAAAKLSRMAIPTHRQRQIRVQLGIHGIPRLPPHHEATWQTSSLYTFSPISGLIASHEVESIRPLPGVGVAEWLRSRLLGWAKEEEGVPCPRAVAVEQEEATRRFEKVRKDEK